MEELACLKGLCYAMHKIQARHVFVCNLWIDAHHLWMIKRRDKSEHVTNRWQVGVRAWLIRFGLQGKAQRIATVYGIVTEEVDGISHALNCHNRIFACFCIDAFPPAPENICARSQLNAQINS